MKKNKQRLDALVMQVHPSLSRAQAQQLIVKGAVLVNGSIATKPGVQCSSDAEIMITDELRYVSKAGYKLEKALDHFSCDVSGLIVLDAGISTGGFSDCLLQYGCAKIYGIDVGHNIVHKKIATDPRVTVYEGCNLRYVKELPELVDLVTLDVSFISLKKIIPAVVSLMQDNAQLITLIKPQFEAEPKEIGRGGIIKDSKIHERIRDDLIQFICSYGFECQGFIQTDVDDPGNKNIEFLVYFKRK